MNSMYAMESSQLKHMFRFEISWFEIYPTMFLERASFIFRFVMKTMKKQFERWMYRHITIYSSQER